MNVLEILALAAQGLVIIYGFYMAIFVMAGLVKKKRRPSWKNHPKKSAIRSSIFASCTVSIAFEWNHRIKHL